MDILNEDKKGNVSKPEMEQVQKQKQEYKLIEQWLRTPGLNLYAYNHLKDEIFLVKIDFEQNGICYTKVLDGKLVVDTGKSYKKTLIDPRNTHFEALNMKNAVKRVNNFKNKKIKDLCNLRPIGKGINFF